jgi:hypothetical protein
MPWLIAWLADWLTDLRSVMGAGPMKARAGVARARNEMVRCR